MLQVPGRLCVYIVRMYKYSYLIPRRLAQAAFFYVVLDGTPCNCTLPKTAYLYCSVYIAYRYTTSQHTAPSDTM